METGMGTIPFQDGFQGGGAPMGGFYPDDNMGSVSGTERVRVAMRVRPLVPHELGRGDENIVTTPDNQHVLLSLKSGTKSYRFNAVINEN